MYTHISNITIKFSGNSNGAQFGAQSVNQHFSSPHKRKHFHEVSYSIGTN